MRSADFPDVATVVAMWSPCCEILRRGDQWSEGAMHSGLCRADHGGVLGPTFRLVIHADDHAKRTGT